MAVLTLVAPAAHADSFDGFDDGFGFVRCGFFEPAFVIPTSRGNVIVLRDACGFERHRFVPFRRHFFNDGFFDDDLDNGPRFNVIINGPLI